MAIERRKRPGDGYSVVATACPYCECPIREQQSLADHIRAGCDGLG